MDGHYKSSSLEFDFYFKEFYSASERQVLMNIRNIANPDGNCRGAHGVLIKPGGIILHVCEGVYAGNAADGAWNQGSASWTPNTWYRVRIDYNADTKQSSVTVSRKSDGTTTGGVTGGGFSSLSSVGQGYHILLAGGNTSEGAHALSGSQFENVVLRLEPGGPICYSSSGGGSCGGAFSNPSGSPRPNDEAMGPPPGAHPDAHGTCSEIACNIGHDVCGGKKVAFDVPLGETCQFTGFVQIDTVVWRNPASFSIAGPSCNANLTLDQCGPQNFDVTCTEGTVEFESSESLYLQFSEVSPACDGGGTYLLEGGGGGNGGGGGRGGHYGTCESNPLCNIGHELCGAVNQTFDITESCTFTGVIQSDQHMWRNPLRLEVVGNGCSQAITANECGTENFSITCEPGTVTFSTSESASIDIQNSCGASGSSPLPQNPGTCQDECSAHFCVGDDVQLCSDTDGDGCKEPAEILPCHGIITCSINTNGVAYCPGIGGNPCDENQGGENCEMEETEDPDPRDEE